MTAPYPPQAAAGKDHTTLWGVLGIVLGFFCCFVFGLVFGALSIRDARRFGRSPTLGYVAIALAVVGLLLNIAAFATDNIPGT